MAFSKPRQATHVIPESKVRAYRMMGNLRIYTIDTDKKLHQIKGEIDKLITKANETPLVIYYVNSALGSAEDIMPMFAKAPRNCLLPIRWKTEDNAKDYSWWID